jgi:hypothetical protein
VSETDFVAPSAVAVIFATTFEPATGTVAIVKVAVDEWAAIVTLAGTDATGLSLARLTTTPPAGAMLLSETVPITGDPPPTVDRDTVRFVNVGGLTVRLAWTVVPPYAMDTVTVRGVAVGSTLIAKLAVCCPG